jgi:hypothetical protein
MNWNIKGAKVKPNRVASDAGEVDGQCVGGARGTSVGNDSGVSVSTGPSTDLLLDTTASYTA